MLVSGFINCNTDVFPYDPEKSFIGGKNVSIGIEADGDKYTITFSATGIAMPSGADDVTLAGEYTGLITEMFAGEDF